MTLPLPAVPTRRLLATLVMASLVVLIVRVLSEGIAPAAWAAAVCAMGLTLAFVSDLIASSSAWRRTDVSMTRRLPSAFALGVHRRIPIVFENRGTRPWECELYDRADPGLTTRGLPRRVILSPATETEIHYTAVPTRRGDATFSAADLRVRSRLGLCDLVVRIGVDETRRVYPDFAQVSRYAWLAGNKRLQEIGIKTYQQRGQGTDFKQLAEYRRGDSTRHIDWRATLRLEQPIVRQFQEERDQAVLLLIDCGRRMRSAERAGLSAGGGHFDQVLNAVMLLTYVALKQGDAVGALTCGAPGGERSFAPQKGAHALNALMSELYDVQPGLAHADYLVAAEDLLRRHRRRALVVLITNFRDEDGTELFHALRLLRMRHLVLVASVRERVVDDMLARPLVDADSAVAVASAHLYEQSRRAAFNRLAARDALMVDAVPDRLGIELVNRYHAVKRAGLM